MDRLGIWRTPFRCTDCRELEDIWFLHRKRLCTHCLLVRHNNKELDKDDYAALKKQKFEFPDEENSYPTFGENTESEEDEFEEYKPFTIRDSNI